MQGEAFLNALDQSKYQDLVRADIARANEEDIWTIPSYIGSKGIIQVNHYNELPSVEQLRTII